MGHQVIDIRDIKSNTPDEEIYELIKKESLILVTCDMDFSNILRYPVTSNCGIVLLRLHLVPIDEILTTIHGFIITIPEKDFLGSLTIVRKDRYRIHRM